MAGRFSVEAVFKAVDRITAPVSRMQSRVRRFTRSMSRGLRNANRMVGGLVRGMARGAGTVAKFGAGLIGLGSAATITALNRSADAADSLAKQSRRLQFPIEDLQEWKFVAEQSGVSTELLDKSLGAFSKRLGEAAGGTGPLVSGLKNINPELLKQLQNTDDISTAFGLYIDAIRNADSATEKAALANAAFSRSGLNLTNIADNSAEAIAGMRNEQRENGNITLRQAEAAEAYNDAVNSLKRSLTGLMQNVLLPMTPAITENLRKWREWIVANKDLIRTRVTEFALNLWQRIKDLTTAAVDFSQRYDLADKIGQGLDTLGAFAGFLERNGKWIAILIGGVVTLSGVLKTMAIIMAVVNAVMMLNPVGLIVLGIIALIAYLAAAVIWWDEISAAINSAWASFLEWSGIGEFFEDLWDGVMGTFESAWSFIKGIVDKVVGAVNVVRNAAGKVTDFGSGVADKARNVGSSVAGFFGFGGDDDEAEAQRQVGGPGQMVSPQERVAQSVEESRSTSSAEVTIRDETGRAEVSRGRMGPGLKLQSSGAF